MGLKNSQPSLVILKAAHHVQGCTSQTEPEKLQYTAEPGGFCNLTQRRLDSLKLQVSNTNSDQNTVDLLGKSIKRISLYLKKPEKNKLNEDQKIAIWRTAQQLMKPKLQPMKVTYLQPHQPIREHATDPTLCQEHTTQNFIL